MGTFICWRGGDCGDNGGSNVLMLVAARVGSRQFEKSGWGEEEKEGGFPDFLPCVALDLWKKGRIIGKFGEILIRQTFFTYVKNAGLGDSPTCS
jgi:hypothetical protein